jgi:hypothetical protein
MELCLEALMLSRAIQVGRSGLERLYRQDIVQKECWDENQKLALKATLCQELRRQKKQQTGRPRAQQVGQKGADFALH